MNELLLKLHEQRDAAVKAFEEFAGPLVAENRSLSEDEESSYSEHRASIARVDARIKDLEDDMRASKEQAEARQALTGHVTHVKEATTYGEGSTHSFYADTVRSSSPMWKGHEEARARLAKHMTEMAVDAQADPKVAAHANKKLRNLNRTENGAEARSALSAFEARTGMTTTSGAGGEFVTPVYLESDYAPWNEFGRVFIDQANKQPLPDFGVSINLPKVTGPAGVASQTEGDGVQETDPTSGYITVALSTLAGQVIVSQQLLDRAGPNFQFDKMVQDQLQRDYNYQANLFTLNKAIAAAGTGVATSGTPPSAGAELAMFYANVAEAKSMMTNGSGNILPATHTFATPTQWEWLASRTDGDGGVALVPTMNGPFNAFATSPNETIVQGATGSKVLGTAVFEDGGIPLASTYQQMLVCHMPEVWVFEGDLVPRVIPQTYAQNLQVLLQLYAYIAVLVRYDQAVQVINGAAWVGSPTF